MTRLTPSVVDRLAIQQATASLGGHLQALEYAAGPALRKQPGKDELGCHLLPGAPLTYSLVVCTLYLEGITRLTAGRWGHRY